MFNIKETRYVQTVTGEGITSQWDVYGTDLGIPVYSEAQKRMYFLFGDSFGEGELYPGKPMNWRGTIAGYTSDLDFTNGIKWEGFLDDGNGVARQLVRAHYSKNEAKIERTKISQGGIEIDGTLYVFYESIRFWGEDRWYINYGGVIKSTDGGKTFSKVYDLSWIEPTDDEGVKLASSLILEDMELEPVSNVKFDANAHIAPGFGQMYAADGKDGYIYVYGRLGGRVAGIKVGRVKKEDIECFERYEYLTEFDGDKAVWKPCREGLDAIMAAPEKAEMIPARTSNMTVCYNEYLGKWMLMYYKPGQGIYCCFADTPYGPYSEGVEALPYDHPALSADLPEAKGRSALYGGFTHEKMVREGGKIVSFVVSQWVNRENKPRFYGSRLFEIEFE